VPDPNMPDMITEVLRAENARLIRENAVLTLKVHDCNDQRDQYAKALVLAAAENQALKRSLATTSPN
jgi:hypothetical protein